MRFRLRTLLMVLAVAPPVLAGGVAVVRELTRQIEFFCGSQIKPAAQCHEVRTVRWKEAVRQAKAASNR